MHTNTFRHIKRVNFPANLVFLFCKFQVSVSPDGAPSSVDATIESPNVTSALFDVFLGGNPVSPSLKASASYGLAASLK